MSSLVLRANNDESTVNSLQTLRYGATYYCCNQTCLVYWCSSVCAEASNAVLVVHTPCLVLVFKMLFCLLWWMKHNINKTLLTHSVTTAVQNFNPLWLCFSCIFHFLLTLYNWITLSHLLAYLPFWWHVRHLVWEIVICRSALN